MCDVDAIAAERRRQIAGHYELLLEALRGELPGWAWTRPSGGLSVWIRAAELDPAFATFAQRHGIGIALGSAFSANGGHRDRLRLTLGNDDAAMLRVFALWPQPGAAGRRPTMGRARLSKSSSERRRVLDPLLHVFACGSPEAIATALGPELDGP